MSTKDETILYMCNDVRTTPGLNLKENVSPCIYCPERWYDILCNKKRNRLVDKLKHEILELEYRIACIQNAANDIRK